MRIRGGNILGIFVVLMLTVAFAFQSRASETVEGAKKDFTAAKAELNKQIDDIGKKITDLKTQSAQKSKAVKESTIKDLEAAQERLKKQVNEAKIETNDAWEKFKAKAAKSITSIERKIKNAVKD